MNTKSQLPSQGREIKARKAIAIAIIALFAWMSIGGFVGSMFPKLSTVQENDNAAFLPDNAESTEANAISVKFSNNNDEISTLLLFLGEIDPTNLGQVNAYLATLPSKIIPAGQAPLSDFILANTPILAFPSQDKKAALANVPLRSDVAAKNFADDKPALPEIVKYLRADLIKNIGPLQLTTHVTGIGGIFADLFGAFGSIDSTLLYTTLLVVALILIVVYRSPILWIMPLFSAVIALSFAGGIVYFLAKANIIDLNGQSQGILSVLVLGAATDYALLLIARYREELHHHASQYESMRIALRGVVEPIIASGSTVMAGLLVLLLSDLSSNRGLGPVGAIGIFCAMLSVLTLLPALLLIFGRWVFWPKIPKFDDVDEQLTGFWSKVGRAVDQRPRRVAISTALLLTILAGFSFTLNADGISTTEAFSGRPDSVVGQDRLLEHFPGGEGQPIQIIIKERDRGSVTSALTAEPFISSVVPVFVSQVVPGQPLPAIKVVDGQVLLNATMSYAPDSLKARAAIGTIRTMVHKIDAEILVGGSTAVRYDTDLASRHDNKLIIPIILLVIALILGFLLRSVFASLLLLITVILSFLATMGVSQLVFEHIFGFPGADASFPLFAFVFLVALGIDYNIFLMTRVREETIKLGTRAGVIKGLTVTGGVITSAGVVLAATFAVLGVLPLVFLAELGFAVAFGVLLDTMVVRSLLVPALVRIIGPKIWWPSQLQHESK